MDDLADNLRNILERERVSAHNASGSLICRMCCSALNLTDKRNVRRHLREKHGLKGGDVDLAEKALFELEKTIPKEHENRLAYHEGGMKHSPVSQIPGLPLVKCYLCPIANCGVFLSARSGMRNHLRRVHHMRIGSCKPSGIEYVCQSLTQKRDLVRYFQVFSEGTSVDKSVQHACRETNEGQGLESLSSERAKRLARFTFGRRTEERQITGEVPDWAKCHFVSTARCEEYLVSCGLGIAGAKSLTSTEVVECSWSMSKCFENLGGVFEKIFRRAQKVCDEHNRFRYFRMDIAAPGVFKKDRPFRFFSHDDIGTASLKRYAYWARLTVVIACQAVLNPSIVGDVYISRNIREAVAAFEAYSVREESRDLDDCELHRLIVNICMAVFFERSDCAEGKGQLFARYVYLALCAYETGERDGSWSTATRTGHVLCGVMYSVSCCVALRIYEYTELEHVTDVHADLREALQPCQPIGLTLLVELRAICASQRLWEQVGVEFTPCDDENHGICGYVNGVHLSAKEIGNFVRKLHERIRKEMFDDLFQGEPLPFDTLREAVEGLKDDVSNKTDAYCGLNDRRNEEFMVKVTRWISRQVDKREEVFFSEEWQKKAAHILVMLITCLHLGGGAPGRGTEIGSYFFRNTSCVSRSIFFVPNEILVIPSFDKRRFGLNGNVSFLSRHSDPETSYLLKTFLCFVRPIMQEYLLEHLDSEESKSSIENLLSMGLIKREKLSGEVNKIFAEIGFPLKFLEYRHHSRGLVKLYCIRSNDKTSLQVLVGAIQDDDDCEESLEPAFEDLCALQRVEIEQAAHSVRSATTIYGQFFGKKDQVSLVPYLSTIEKHRMVSHRWQIEIGLREPGTSDGMRRNRRLKKEKGENLTVSEDVVERVARRLFTEIEKSVKRDQDDGGEIFENLGSEEVLPCIESDAGAAEEREMRDNRPTTTAGEVTEYIQELMPVISRPSTAHAFNNGFTALSGLKRAVNSDVAKWKSEVQKEAMIAVAKNDGDTLVVIATGGGKTAVALGPVFFETGYSIWIAPLKALLSETASKMRQLGLHVDTVHTFTRDVRESFGNVLLISPEDLSLERFERIMSIIGRRKLLNRVVIDEAHLVATDAAYRQSMRQLGIASQNGTSANIVMLSATVPDSIQEVVVTGCGSTMTGLDIHKGDPFRGNLRIDVIGLDNGSESLLRDKCVDSVIQLAMSTKGSCRAIVYCLTRSTVRYLYGKLRTSVMGSEVGKRLSFGMYHGELPAEASARQLEFWRREEREGVKVMVATTAFGCGIDAPDVRLVVLAGGCRHLVEFWQEAGRAGRDGKPADVIVLYHERYISHARVDTSVAQNVNTLGNFQRWAEDYITCLVLFLRGQLEQIRFFITFRRSLGDN